LFPNEKGPGGIFANSIKRYADARSLRTIWQSRGKTPLAGLAQGGDDSETGTWAAIHAAPWAARFPKFSADSRKNGQINQFLPQGPILRPRHEPVHGTV